MSTDQQQLERYTKERAALEAQRTTIDARIEALDRVIGGLRVLTGAAPAPKRAKGAGKATGTKALILDVLADGQRRTARQIAAAANINHLSIRDHLSSLVASGDIDRQGQSRATTYGIA